MLLVRFHDSVGVCRSVGFLGVSGMQARLGNRNQGSEETTQEVSGGPHSYAGAWI